MGASSKKLMDARAQKFADQQDGGRREDEAKGDHDSCGQKGSDKNGGLGVHHVGGIVTSERTSEAGHENKMNNIVSICERCHDREHQRAKANGEDASQVTPKGDRGTKRDKGLPPAKVDR